MQSYVLPPHRQQDLNNLRINYDFSEVSSSAVIDNRNANEEDNSILPIA